MSRSQLSQRQRTYNNPAHLGTFGQTSLRLLKGKLGPENKPVGYRDTSQNSNGGIGGGTYNHWFKIVTTVPSWIITIKGPPRPQYIQVAAYDLNNIPITPRPIFQKDSYSQTINGVTTYPYENHVSAARSNLYNFSDDSRVDRGDNRYFILPAGSYLLCISTTRNEPLDYTLGLVIEVETIASASLQLEPGGNNFFVYENGSDFILLDYPDNAQQEDPELQVDHQHSLTDWQGAWDRDHQDDDRFPDLFIPYTTEA